MVSALYILHWPDTDTAYLRCELLLYRNYHNDVPDAHVMVERFRRYYSLLGEHQRTPFLCLDGINYIHVWGSNDLVMVAVTRTNLNAMLTVSLLHQMHQILTHYCDQQKVETAVLDRDFVLDNQTLVYELLDECVDFGMVQVTDFNILKEYIKMEVNHARLTDQSDSDSEEPSSAAKRKLPDISIRSTHNNAVHASVDESFINSSIVRTQALAISWRPKGIYYPKNEIYIDIIESSDFLYDLEGQEVKMNRVYGVCQVRSYLSGMPQCKLGLNEKYISQVEYDGYEEEEEDMLQDAGNQLPQPETVQDAAELQPEDDAAEGLLEPAQKKRYKVPITNVQFHQCIELSRVYKENLIFFTPPDDEFQLLSYRVEQQRRKDKKPLLMIAPTYRVLLSEKKLHIMCTLTTGLKKNLHCHKVVVKLPVHPKVFPLANAGEDSFRFRCELGDVRYKVDTSELLWAIPDLPGSKKAVRMMAEVSLAASSHITSDLFKSVLYHKNEHLPTTPDEAAEESTSELDRYYKVAGATSSLFTQVQLEVETHSNSLVSRNEVSIDFEVPMLAYSGLRVTYLRVDEEQMKYTCFPWVRYMTQSKGESKSGQKAGARYRFKMGMSNYEIMA